MFYRDDRIENLIDFLIKIHEIVYKDGFTVKCEFKSAFGRTGVNITVTELDPGRYRKRYYYSSFFEEQRAQVNVFKLGDFFEYSLVKEAKFLRKILWSLNASYFGRGFSEATKVLTEFIDSESHIKALEKEYERLKCELCVTTTEKAYEKKHKKKEKPEKNKTTVQQKTYLMLDEATGFYKIGKSYNPEFRERTLMAQRPTIRLLWETPKNVESDLHIRYSHRRVRGEWFSLNENDVNEIKQMQ